MRLLPPSSCCSFVRSSRSPLCSHVDQHDRIIKRNTFMEMYKCFKLRIAMGRVQRCTVQAPRSSHLGLACEFKLLYFDKVDANMMNLAHELLVSDISGIRE